ncbi:MAG: hypothetical protein R3E93_10035 [Thiothrix sp.]
MSQITASLDTLVARFGVEETLQLLEYSQPFVRQWEQQLRDALLSGDWESAAHCAHKAISSVRLYGSPRLEALLYQVRDGDNATVIQHDLFEEFTAVNNMIAAWVAEHKDVA